MKRQRKCRNCRERFLPDRRSYRPTRNPSVRISPQRFCSNAECQRESDRRSHCACLKKNLFYREKSLQAARRWRKKHPDYWKSYRADPLHAGAVKRNRLRQRHRDARSKADLANNNSIEAVHTDKLRRIEVLIDLANINSIEVPWTVVSDEIRLYLKWRWRLANIKAIDTTKANKPQCQA